MSNSWRVISLVVLIAILLGAVCVGVGLVTGGEWDRIFSGIESRYSISTDPDRWAEWAHAFRDEIRNGLFSSEAPDESTPDTTPAPEEIASDSDAFVVIPGDASAPAATPEATQAAAPEATPAA